MSLVWVVPLIPLAGFAVNLAVGRRLGRNAAVVASAAMVLAFLLSVGVLIDLLGLPAESRVHVTHVFDWIASGSFSVGVDLRVDPLSMTMTLVVTGVGALIHIYSIGYMEGDPRFAGFFAQLNLFCFFMLVLVLAQNYLLMYLGWEGVGLCSYLLIGFWFERLSAANAAKKAFITTRIGDTMLLLGIALIWTHVGSLDFSKVLSPDAAGLTRGAATAIALLLLGGAVGKSAQLPLHVWLPDAMEGPTPVSALIHAATMVTAGVYLILRSHVLFELSGTAEAAVLVIGLASAVYAALASIGQLDLKRSLAYSTMSQIGFMFLAAGLRFGAGAMLLLVCHSFYKALLFLSSGNVMHGTAGEIDMRRLGGLREDMPLTAAMFGIGALSLAGVPPLAGFFAKDPILGFASNGGHTLAWSLASVGALLSAVYVSRAWFLTFFGRKRFDGSAHEAPRIMTVPLVALAIGAVAGGALGLPATGGLLARFLEPAVGRAVEGSSGPPEILLLTISTALAAGGVALAWWVWGSGRVEWEAFGERQPELQDGLAHAFYIDDLYAWFVQMPAKGVAGLLARFDREVIDGAVKDVGGGVRRISRVAPVWESGLVRTYALSFAIGAAVLLVILGLRI